MQGAEVEREALRRLPAILAELFDEPETSIPLQAEPADRGVDAFVDGGGRRWRVEVKSSAGPGVVARADEHLRGDPSAAGVPLLVVPFMSPAGAKLADERRLNWVDLSGNAHVRDEQLHIWVQGRPNAFPSRGRPSSAFAPKSSRVARALLGDPERWWRQKELGEVTGLDSGRVSRVVQRLAGEDLLEQEEGRLRARDRDLLLDAWADEYRFDRHDIVTGHVSGSGVSLARELERELTGAGMTHAFTGLPAAWALDGFASFRLVSVFVSGDPREAAEGLGMRRNERGANVQLIGPDDPAAVTGALEAEGLRCASRVQVYLDLLHLPERAAEAAEHLRAEGLWPADA